MRNLDVGIHPIPDRPLYLASSGCIVSCTVAVSQLASYPSMLLETDVLEAMTGTPVGDVDVMAVPPEAAVMERRLVEHLARTYALGDSNALHEGEYQSQLLWCNGAAFHEDACFDCILAVVLWHGPPRDLVLPHLGVRVPMKPGTVVLFDSAQPHGLLVSDAARFESSHYLAEADRSVLCTLDLPRDLPGLRALMAFDTDPRSIPQSAFRIRGSTTVDARSGQWLGPQSTDRSLMREP